MLSGRLDDNDEQTIYKYMQVSYLVSNEFAISSLGWWSFYHLPFTTYNKKENSEFKPVELNSLGRLDSLIFVWQLV